ncbi:hypothetical protein EJ04DRAFT_52833 [Polyplosphaeria fusca]|uniref:Uncharacterized protein n=1 Tax=Polyplosphaeria fusca TaxID=682080 RepID=A0A9P4R5F6_9PLEO|nr:hypothetical protein EJ04DRAFT_52833 [Polyplosphaeria fusca]
MCAILTNYTVLCTVGNCNSSYITCCRPPNAASLSSPNAWRIIYSKHSSSTPKIYLVDRPNGHIYTGTSKLLDPRRTRQSRIYPHVYGRTGMFHEEGGRPDASSSSHLFEPNVHVCFWQPHMCHVEMCSASFAQRSTAQHTHRIGPCAGHKWLHLPAEKGGGRAGAHKWRYSCHTSPKISHLDLNVGFSCLLSSEGTIVDELRA